MSIQTIIMMLLMLVLSLAFREERKKLALDEVRCSFFGGKNDKGLILLG